jgi:hypothetical protein
VPTTPVQIDVKTLPDGSVTVSINIAGSAVTTAVTGMGTQLDGGTYGINGIGGAGADPKGGVFVTPGIGPDQFVEQWILEDNPGNMDAFKTGGFMTNYLGAAVSIGDTIRKAGITSPWTILTMYVDYVPLGNGAVPVPVDAAEKFVFECFNVGPGAHPGPQAYLYRSWDPNGIKQDTWAFKDTFQKAGPNMEIQVQPGGGPLDRKQWATMATNECQGGKFAVIVY